MVCNLMNNITKDSCQYQVAGIKAIYLINYNPKNKLEEEGLTLVEGEKAYEVEFIDGTASWTDDLAVNGNGGKYRTHTLNFTLSDYNHAVLSQSNALSLGKFSAIVVDKSGNRVILGRDNGLSATSFNYASGAADADANGWTTVLAGTEMNVGLKLDKSFDIDSIVAESEEPASKMQIIA